MFYEKTAVLMHITLFCAQKVMSCMMLWLKTGKSREAHDIADIQNVMLIPPDNDGQSTFVPTWRTFRSEDSEVPDEFGKSRLERYQDEAQRIKDAIADDSWYTDDEPANEDEYDTGDRWTILSTFRINAANIFPIFFHHFHSYKVSKGNVGTHLRRCACYNKCMYSLDKMVQLSKSEFSRHWLSNPDTEITPEPPRSGPVNIFSL